MDKAKSRTPYFRHMLFTYRMLLLPLAMLGCRTTDMDLCNRDVVMTGQLLKFIDGQVLSYGWNSGTPAVPTGATEATWRFRADADGVQIFTRAECFKEVDQFIRNLYRDEPDISRSNYVAYSVRHSGVSVSYGVANGTYPPVGNPFIVGNYLHIVVSRPQSTP
jgi:hypothetical protein